MMHSAACREFVAAWESLRLVAYDDGGGVWTIGYGHTLGVRAGDTCTKQQADAWLDTDLESAANDVRRLVHVPLAQNQFDALASFTLNLGATALFTSRLLKRVNGAEHDKAVAELLRWNKDNGAVLHGLLARRAGEGLVYAFGDYTGK